MAIVVVVIAVALIFRWPNRIGGEAVGRHAWQPPPQTQLSESMNAAPVPGWRARATDLGLPAGEGSDPTRIATSDDPQFADPFVGNVDDHAYFLAGSPAATGKQWWLTGLDVATGHRIFAPVPLNIGTRAPRCFLNGPTAVLCIEDDGRHANAWVIDVPTGRVSFSGPTRLSLNSGHNVVQVGIYAVSQSMDEGVFGVGPQAETTWFVPGEGTVSGRLLPRDFAPQTLTTQTALGLEITQSAVFRVSDGHVFTTDLPEGLSAGGATVYPGGFAIEVLERGRGARLRSVNFFAEDGRRLEAVDFEHDSYTLDRGAADLPILKSGHESTIYGADGSVLLETAHNSDELLIGSRLFLEGERHVEQYDLRTGAKIDGCRFGYGQSTYIATDGKVGLFQKGGQKIGMETYGVDLATCKILWTTVAPPGDFHYIWRINTTLVQLSDDATELISMVARRG